eukprot:6490265-Amphidinium_carterae.2
MDDSSRRKMIRKGAAETAIRVSEQVVHITVWFRPGRQELSQHVSGISALQADGCVQASCVTNNA